MKFILSVVCETTDEVRGLLDSLGREDVPCIEAKAVEPPKPAEPKQEATETYTEQHVWGIFDRRYKELKASAGDAEAKSVLKGVLKSFGAGNVTKLKPEDYAEFVKAIQGGGGNV